MMAPEALLDGALASSAAPCADQRGLRKPGSSSPFRTGAHMGPHLAFLEDSKVMGN